MRFSELQEEVFAFKALGFVTEISTTSAWDEEGIDVETQGFKVTTDGALRDLEREVEAELASIYLSLVTINHKFKFNLH